MTDPARPGEGSGNDTAPQFTTPRIPEQPGRTPSPPGPGPGPAALTERAVARVRGPFAVVALLAGLIVAVGVLADMTSLYDFISSDEHAVLAWVIRVSLVAAPVAAAAAYFLGKDWPIFVGCVAGLALATVGAYSGGSAVERAKTPAETGRKCETKPYDGEPAKLQDCSRIVLAEGGTADLDDKSTRATNSPKGPDVELTALTLTPVGRDVRMAILDSTTIKDGKYPLSYPGCAEPESPATEIDLKDLSDKAAICVHTDEGRVAIIWVVDIDDEHRSAVFNLTCWKKKR